MKTNRWVAICCALALSMACVGNADAQRKSKAEKKRGETNAMASEVLDRLQEENPKAKELYGKSYGYAVFENIKISLGLSGGGGHGVAVKRSSGERVYMKMGTVGLNIGLGAQKYQVVFLFQNESTFNKFVDKGWEADANANAVAGTSGANLEVGFRNGVAIYQFTKAGLMLQADIAGTKYWKNKKLNN